MCANPAPQDESWYVYEVHVAFATHAAMHPSMVSKEPANWTEPGTDCPGATLECDTTDTPANGPVILCGGAGGVASIDATVHRGETQFCKTMGYVNSRLVVPLKSHASGTAPTVYPTAPVGDVHNDMPCSAAVGDVSTVRDARAPPTHSCRTTVPAAATAGGTGAAYTAPPPSVVGTHPVTCAPPDTVAEAAAPGAVRHTTRPVPERGECSDARCRGVVETSCTPAPRQMTRSASRWPPDAASVSATNERADERGDPAGTTREHGEGGAAKNAATVESKRTVQIEMGLILWQDKTNVLQTRLVLVNVTIAGFSDSPFKCA